MKPILLTPSQSLAEAIAQEAPPDRIAKVLADGLAATVMTRSGTVVPDTRNRLLSAQILLSYSIGRPVERQEIVSVNLDADASVGLAERLKNSPALRKSLRQILDATES